MRSPRLGEFISQALVVTLLTSSWSRVTNELDNAAA